MGLFEQYLPQYREQLGANNPVLGPANQLSRTLNDSEAANGRLASTNARSAIFGSDQADPNQRSDESKQFQVNDALKQFYEEMNKPLDMNDPYVKSITTGVYNQANQDVRNRGLGADWAQNAAMSASANAATGVQDQRRQLGLQALGMSANQLQGIASLRQKAAGLQYEGDMNQYNQRMDTGRGIGGIIGGAIGALPALLPGGAAIAPLTMSAGAGLGAGLGGMSAGPAPTLKLNSGLGRGNYSGGY